MKLRYHKSRAGTIFVAGRNDETNEILISQVKPAEEVFHTRMAGSPFVRIVGAPKRGDIKEAATMCARYSRDWKKFGRDVYVERFSGRDIYKTPEMKIGTFGVKKFRTIKIKKGEILSFVARPLKKGERKELENGS